MSPELAAVVAGWVVVAAPTREAWLEARRRYLTASDVAAVLGLHPFKNRAKVVAEKRAGLAGEQREWQWESMAMRAGNYLEEPVLRWWLDDQRAANARDSVKYPRQPLAGGVVRGQDGQSLLVAHPDAVLRLAASPDALVVWAGEVPLTELCEVKVHGPKQWANWEVVWTDRTRQRAAQLGLDPAEVGIDAEHEFDWPCPIQHWVQLQTQLLCTGHGSGWVVGNCGSERREHRFAADPAFHARVLAATREFWTEVEQPL